MTSRRGVRWAHALLLVVTLLGAQSLLCGVALPADSTVSVALTGSTLAISAAPGLGTFVGTLDGTAHILQGAGFSGFSVTDARGSGVGWQVTMKASRFENLDAEGRDLAPDSLTAPLFTVSKDDSGSSASPGSVSAATIDNESGAVIASCTAAGQGMGSYEFTAPSSAWRLAVTADEFAGTYSSTLTTTVATLAL
jgi:hypothetical protein